MRTLATLTLLFTCVWFTGCQTNPATGKSQLILLSSEQTTAMGESAKPELTAEYGGEVQSPELRAYVDRIGRDLLRHIEVEYADLPWEFTVLDSDVVNAFALPGGKVFMSRGLMEYFTSEAEVAGVLGHEIGHVTGRHVDERISRATAAQVGVGILGVATNSELAVVSANLFSQGYLLKFGRDQESQADVLGVRYLVRSGYDPQGMLKVLHVLNTLSQGGSQPEFLSTHPHPETRLETVSGLIETTYAETQGNPAYQMYEDRFQQQAAPYLNLKQLP